MKDDDTVDGHIVSINERTSDTNVAREDQLQTHHRFRVINACVRFSLQLLQFSFAVFRAFLNELVDVAHWHLPRVLD